MEVPHHIDFVFWLGTSLMVALVLAFIVLALTYQNHFFKMKKNESDLLLKATLETERKERKRLAADMHDSILSDLNAVKVFLAIIKKEGIENYYDELTEGVEQAIESTRQMSYNLMPPLLESQGLAASLKDYLKKLSVKTNIIFSVEEEHPINISLSNKYELYRILQELTTNMIKHGTPSKCTIILNTCDDAVTIHIADDGVVFDFEESMKSSTGAGLRNIASRLRMLDATLSRKDSETGNYHIISIKA